MNLSFTFFFQTEQIQRYHLILFLPVQSVPGVVECLKIITRTKSLRIADYAFRTARESGRGRVTAVHKANIMSVSDPVGI